MFLIATRPGRVVKRPKNDVQKFAQVRPDGKFKWVTDPNDATAFATVSDLEYAMGVRATKLRNEPTHDVTTAEATAGGVTVTKINNGH